MEIIKSNITHNLKMEKYFPEKNVCFVDIETTGLNRNKEIIYLIGLLFFNRSSDSWVLNQYFANSIEMEKDILGAFNSEINNFDVVITYNGDSFDLPFIRYRLKRYDIDGIYLDDITSFDLYKIIRSNNMYLNLPNLKLKTLEQFLGIEREDKLSGFECIGLYYDYMESNNSVLRENILKHNYDDLVNMLDTMNILDILDRKKSFYTEFKNIHRKISIDSVKTVGDSIVINGQIQPKMKSNLKYYRDNYSLNTESHGEFFLSLYYKIGFVEKDLKGLYIDKREFEELPLVNNNSPYKLLPNIILLKVGNLYYIENIKSLVEEIFKSID
ncbi:MAG: ribonuclease H-like domain-containing protein [Tissierellaceae bacterium]|nr:ribonuclease H-like domain-containing protein [Tissierellaceae bacterium]